MNVCVYDLLPTKKEGIHYNWMHGHCSSWQQHVYRHCVKKHTELTICIWDAFDNSGLLFSNIDVFLAHHIVCDVPTVDLPL